MSPEEWGRKESWSILVNFSQNCKCPASNRTWCLLIREVYEYLIAIPKRVKNDGGEYIRVIRERV
jgi:hypothetical protein